MEVVIRKSSDNDWGFVEEFNVYRYLECGSITVTLEIDVNGRMVSPYVLRGGEFVPISVIEEEMGIEKYINAKKPFYSKLGEGFIVKIKAGLNYVTGEFLPEKSTYIIYEAKGKSDMQPTQGKLQLSRVLEIPETLHNLMLEVSKQVVACQGDKAEFLRSRIYED